MKLARAIYQWIKVHVLGVDPRSQIEIAVANGLQLGKDVAIMGECIIDPGHCWLIAIGDRVTLAPRVHILAHDASTKRMLGYTRIARVTIGNDVFVGANSIILPGVHIGNRVVIGAGSVVARDIPDNSVAVGNPAKVIKSFEKYMQEQKELLNLGPHYDEEYKVESITASGRERMCRELEKGTGYVI